MCLDLTTPDLGRRSSLEIAQAVMVGMSTPFAGLKGSKTPNDPLGSNVVQIVLSGQKAKTATSVASMPSFRRSLNDSEITAVANYLVGRFGDKAGSVTLEQVAK
ncbi:hypothetical protein QD409_18685 [Rhizobium sp. BR 315]